MDLDQTGTETSFGQPNGVIRFGDLDLIFKVTKVNCLKIQVSPFVSAL